MSEEPRTSSPGPTPSGGPFRALRSRPYRLFFCGQVLSVIGTWTQATAVAWILVRETGDGKALGLVIALQFFPLLLLGAWSGALADRLDRRHLLLGANIAAGLVALATAVAVASGHTSVSTLATASLLLGLTSAIETPARQSFVSQLVTPVDLQSALGLNGAIMTGSRLLGSALAGLLIATLGAETCLYVNAASFLAAIAALALLGRENLRASPRLARAKGQVRAGLRYAWRNVELRLPLLSMAVVGTLAFNAQVTTPLLARITFRAGPALFAAFSAAGGFGALLGSIRAASRRKAEAHHIAVTALGFGAMTLAIAAAPRVELGLVAMAVASFFGSQFIQACSARVQTVTASEFRGRVTALYSILFLGSTPIGSLIMSALIDATNPRFAYVLAGTTTVLCGVAVHLRSRPAVPFISEGGPLPRHSLN